MDDTGTREGCLEHIDTQTDTTARPDATSMDDARASELAPASVRGGRPLARRALLPAPAEAGALLAECEQVRLARMANLLLLAFIGVGVVLMPAALALGQPLPPLVAVVSTAMLAALLNRLGWTQAAMTLAILACDAWIGMAFVAAPAGNADLLWALLLPTLLAAIFLPSHFCLPFGLAQCLLAVGLVFGAGVAGDPHALLSARVLAYLERPLAGQIAVAILAYCWVRGMTRALARADRSAEVLALRQREAQRKRTLDEGVRELLAAHAQLANGNFDVAVPELGDAALWRIGHSLNQLLAQLRRFAEVDSLLMRTYEEAEHLALAVRHAYDADGAPVSWPKPSGTPLDPILAALVSAHTADATDATPHMPAQDSAVPGSRQVEPRPAADLDGGTMRARPLVSSMPLGRGITAPPRLVQTRIPDGQDTRRMDAAVPRPASPLLGSREPGIEQVVVLRTRDDVPERLLEG